MTNLEIGNNSIGPGGPRGVTIRTGMVPLQLGSPEMFGRLSMGILRFPLPPSGLSGLQCENVSRKGLMIFIKPWNQAPSSRLKTSIRIRSMESSLAKLVMEIDGQVYVTR